MVSCGECWWADRNAETGEQVLHYEPDYSQMKHPNDRAPDTRVILSCGKGKNFFKSFGFQAHNCKEFVSEAEQREVDDAANEKKRKQWKYPTERNRLPTTSNVLMLLEDMAEGDNEAFDILCDAMAYGPETIAEIISNLDDMNIRGGQIVLALRCCDNDVLELQNKAKQRSKTMMRFINEHYKNASKEEAVQRGARKYGHRPWKQKTYVPINKLAKKHK